MALNYQSSCLSLPSARFTGIRYHPQLGSEFEGSQPGIYKCFLKAKQMKTTKHKQTENREEFYECGTLLPYTLLPSCSYIKGLHTPFIGV